jgi:hypothetical protein
VHTGFVGVEINRYFELVYTRVEITKLPIVDSQVVSTEVYLLLSMLIITEVFNCGDKVFVSLFELVEFRSN